MTTGKTVLLVAGIAAIVALGIAYKAKEQARAGKIELATGESRQAAVDVRLSALKEQVQVETRRVLSAEAENARLQQAITEQQKPAVVTAAEEQPVTSDIVQARLTQTRQLVQSGDFPKALEEMIWLFDVGMKQVPSMSAVRRSFGTSLFAELAGKYPPARAALDGRREAARQKMLADAEDYDAMADYGAMTRYLKDGATAIALLEQFPTGDRRRAGLARAAFDDLIDTRRYALALEGRNAASMLSLFESTKESPGAKTQPEEMQRQMREATAKRVARDIEVLAGAGDLENARKLAGRLLEFDHSESTRAILSQHLTRAEQPNLMVLPTP